MRKKLNRIENLLKEVGLDEQVIKNIIDNLTGQSQSLSYGESNVLSSIRQGAPPEHPYGAPSPSSRPAAMAVGDGSSGERPVAQSDPGKSMVMTVRPNPFKIGRWQRDESFIFPIFVGWPFSSTIHSTARPAATHNAHSSTACHINRHDSSHPSRSSTSPDPHADPASRLPFDARRPMCSISPPPCVLPAFIYPSSPARNQAPQITPKSNSRPIQQPSSSRSPSVSMLATSRAQAA
ncbi:hypothetical protein ACLOJK_006872 [Asimina triloba]